MEKVPTGGLCAVFPQWYLADLLTGITSPHRLCLIYILRPSKLQQHSYSKNNPWFSGFFAVVSVGYRVSTYHLALQETQAVHFDFLIWSQISPCPDMFAFLFTLVALDFASLSLLKLSPSPSVQFVYWKTGKVQFAQLLEVPSFHHLLAIDPTPIRIFAYVS